MGQTKEVQVMPEINWKQKFASTGKKRKATLINPEFHELINKGFHIQFL